MRRSELCQALPTELLRPTSVALLDFCKSQGACGALDPSRCARANRPAHASDPGLPTPLRQAPAPRACRARMASNTPALSILRSLQASPKVVTWAVLSLDPGPSAPPARTANECSTPSQACPRRPRYAQLQPRMLILGLTFTASHRSCPTDPSSRSWCPWAGTACGLSASWQRVRGAGGPACMPADRSVSWLQAASHRFSW